MRTRIQGNVFSLLSTLCLAFFSVNAFAKVDAPLLLTKIHVANQLEIKTGNIAEQKAQTKEVKKYAKQVITHHKMTDKLVVKLVDFRDTQFVNLATDPADQMMLVNLQRVQGIQFDHVYIREMIKAHKKVIADLEQSKAALDMSQPDLYMLVRSILPVLKLHLKQAQKIQMNLQKKSMGMAQQDQQAIQNQDQEVIQDQESTQGQEAIQGQESAQGQEAIQGQESAQGQEAIQGQDSLQQQD